MKSVCDLFGLPTSRLELTVYRFHNPKWAFDPLSGEGARLTGGRFNPKGMNALYTSLEPDTALQEVIGTASSKLVQPMLLCSYQVELERVTDLRTFGALFSAPWRKQILSGEIPPGHQYANHVVSNDLSDAIIVPSYQNTQGSNLVLFRYDENSVKLNDSEGRLKSI